MKKMHSKIIMCLVLLLLMPATFAQQQAEVMPLSDQSLILSITAVGDALVMVGERGHVLKSDDEGKSWRQIEAVPVNIALTKVVSVNNHLWAVGHDAAIIHSADAGETWQLQFYDAEREVPFLSAYFKDENNGFVIGAYGTILTTSDAGKNWQEGLIDEELDYHLNDIAPGPDGQLYIAAEAGYFFRSFDQGETWEAIELPYMGSMFGVAMAANEVVLFGLRGNVLTSSDQGDTWHELNAPEPNNIFGSTALKDDQLLLVGANGARLVYQNQKLTNFKGSDSGDDYADAIKIGQRIILVGEAGVKSQPIEQ